MSRLPRSPISTLAVLAVLAVLAFGAPGASAQTLRVLTAGAFKQVVVAVAPEHERATGVRVDVDNDTAGALVRRVRAGERFDVIMLPPASLKTLADAGAVAAASVAPVATVAIGVAVRRGEPRPALATVEDFRLAVLRARRVAYIDPAAGGSSGIYLDGLFQRMGIADEVRAKAVLVPGGLVAERLVTGEADLAIHQVSEILPVAGAELVGPLPEPIQNRTTYAVAVSSRTPAADAARAFAEALAAPSAAALLRAKGMEPAR